MPYKPGFSGGFKHFWEAHIGGMDSGILGHQHLPAPDAAWHWGLQ